MSETAVRMLPVSFLPDVRRGRGGLSMSIGSDTMSIGSPISNAVFRVLRAVQCSALMFDDSDNGLMLFAACSL